VRAPEEPGWRDFSRRVEGSAVAREAADDFQPPGPGEGTGRGHGAGPRDGHRDGERAAVAARIGVPGERVELAALDAQREAERTAGCQILIDQRDHGAVVLHRPLLLGQGSATVRRWGRSTLA